jgi:hypothetical protein
MSVAGVAAGLMRVSAMILSAVADRLQPRLEGDRVDSVDDPPESLMTDEAAAMVVEAPSVESAPEPRPLEGSVEWRLAKARRLG